MDYKGQNVPIDIICPVHGVFRLTPFYHLANSYGCGKCGHEGSTLKQRKPEETYIAQAIAAHGDECDYSNTRYVNKRTKIEVKCKKCGTVYSVMPNTHLRHESNDCPLCRSRARTSREEEDLCKAIREVYDGEIQRSRKDLYDGRHEIDIYLPELKIGIEFDGLRWHSDRIHKWYRYHLDKTIGCLEKGIYLIHVFEDEWLYKREIVIAYILSIIRKAISELHVKDCIVKPVDITEANDFLEVNHIIGKCKSSYRYGLYHMGELVSLMAVRKTKGKKDSYELVRYCNKLRTNVIGGAEMLLKYFSNMVKKGTLKVELDRRWFDGRACTELGFTFSHETEPVCYYVHGDTRLEKLRGTAKKAVDNNTDPNLSEDDILSNMEIYRMHDCGRLVYTRDIGGITGSFNGKYTNIFTV